MMEVLGAIFGVIFGYPLAQILCLFVLGVKMDVWNQIYMVWTSIYYMYNSPRVSLKNSKLFLVNYSLWYSISC